MENYVTWYELLEKIAETLHVDGFTLDTKYKKFLSEGKNDGEAKQALGTYLNELLFDKIENNQASDIFTKDEIKYIMENNLDAFKCLVVKQLPSTINIKTDKTYYKTELDEFQKFSSLVPCIFTTNYDCFLEYLFQNKFTTYIDQSDYFYSEPAPYTSIYKIHGSVSKPNSIILTERDYSESIKKSHLTSSKILQVLSNHPIIFIGYSLNDSDISQIFENLISCLTQEQLQELKNNLLFIDYHPHVKTMYANEKEYRLINKSLTLTYISTDNFTCLFKYINSFTPFITPAQLKTFYSTIKELIQQNDERLPKLIANAANLDNLQDEIAITAVGTNEESYSKIPQTEPILDVLYELNKYDALSILGKWFSQYIPYNANVPLYYYIKKCDKSQLKSLSADAKDKINNYLKRKNEMKPKETDLYSRISELESALKKCDKQVKKIPLLIYNYYNCKINRDQYIKYLREIYEKEQTLIGNGDFKKAIVFLDFDKKIKNIG